MPENAGALWAVQEEVSPLSKVVLQREVGRHNTDWGMAFSGLWDKLLVANFRMVQTAFLSLHHLATLVFDLCGKVVLFVSVPGCHKGIRGMGEA